LLLLCGQRASDEAHEVVRQTGQRVCSFLICITEFIEYQVSVKFGVLDEFSGVAMGDGVDGSEAADGKRVGGRERESAV
jgi:hypothetical protein